MVTRERMIQASIAANEQGNNTVMRRIFNEIADPIRVAALDEAIAELDRQGFECNDRYIATIEPGHMVSLGIAGITGGRFMARTDDAILIGRTADLPSWHRRTGEWFILKPSA